MVVQTEYPAKPLFPQFAGQVHEHGSQSGGTDRVGAWKDIFPANPVCTAMTQGNGGEDEHAPSRPADNRVSQIAGQALAGMRIGGT